MINALHGKTAGLNGDNGLVAGADRVDCQKSKAWRTIDQDIIVETFDFIDNFRKFKLAADLIRLFLLERAHQDVGGDNIKILIHPFKNVFDL